MIHDPLCPHCYASDEICDCEFIARVRADERNEIKIRLQMIERLIGGSQIRLAINTIDKRGKDESTHYSRSGD
jgi:hypothetical protein